MWKISQCLIALYWSYLNMVIDLEKKIFFYKDLFSKEEKVVCWTESIYPIPEKKDLIALLKDICIQNCFYL